MRISYKGRSKDYDYRVAVEDMDEFKMFSKDWREAVKMIKDCMKYGF